MLKWLRSFFYSDDPDVRIATGLSEPEAAMWQELLASNDIPSFTKNRSFLSVTHLMPADDTDPFVRQSDEERAIEVLGLSHPEKAQQA